MKKSKGKQPNLKKWLTTTEMKQASISKNPFTRRWLIQQKKSSEETTSEKKFWKFIKILPKAELFQKSSINTSFCEKN